MMSRCSTIRGLLVLAAATFTAFFPASALAQNPPPDVRGVYVYTNDVSSISTGTTNLLTASLNINGMDGIAIVIGWDAIEPAMGQYQWTLLDQWIQRATSLGKKIDLVVPAGSSEPAWLFQKAPTGAGATGYSFTVSPHGGQTGVCNPVTMAAPWDPIFLTQWDAMLGALAAHLKSAGTYDAITLVRLTGLNRTTEETRIPAESAQAGGLTCITDAVATWQQAGYKPSLITQSWNSLLHSFAKSFSDKTFAVSLIPSAAAFPPIGENGSVTPVPANFTYQLLSAASQQFPGRLVVQFDFLMPGEAPSSDVIGAAQTLGTMAAFQTNEYFGGSGAACSEPVTNPTPCTAATFLTMLETGIYPLGKTGTLRSQYIEVFHDNAAAFPDDIQQAHLELTCDYKLSAGGQAFSAQGGAGTVTITTGVGCPWAVGTPPSGITLTSPSSGTGNGTVGFQVLSSTGGDASSTFTVAGQTFTVEQQAASIPGLAALGSLGHVTSEGTWDFSLTAVNLGTTSTTTRFSFLDNNGTALSMPWTFPQQSAGAGPTLAAVLDRPLSPNAQVILASTGPDNVTQLIGSGRLQATGAVSGFGVFSDHLYHWNAVVPLESRNAGKYVLAFDNTTAGSNALATGVAVANLSSSGAAIPVVLRDDTGAQIGTATINLPAQGHTSFMLNVQYGVTTNKRGTIEFDTPQNGQISVLGLRANGGALTTLPVLASSDAAGGAIAHATYNGGFTSVFYLVNTGAAAASFTLNFYDEGGNPLAVPLSLPQTGVRTTTSALTQTLAPFAMLAVETVSNDAAASVAGSAQLSSTGSVSGFEIFRWTTFGQEASVPLEIRTPSSFLLVFDDTGGLTTGVALANVSATAANVTAKIYDDAGNSLQTVNIPLPGHGHTSFLLPLNYSSTANKRGMVEFVVPAGGKINAVGLRAKADGTLTTIPLLTR